MAAAIENRRKLNAGVAAANIQRADSLWTVNLVPGDGHQVDVVPLHVDRNLANRLHAIGREDNAMFLGNLADFRDGIDDANLIVGIHDCDQNRGWLDGPANILRIYAPIFLDW